VHRAGDVANLLLSQSSSSLTALTLGAIGVVYGDIGTSVLYAVKEVFGSGHVSFTPDNVYGILSLFFWTLTTIVSIKYVVLVLRADNHGEGGLVAMLALASQAVKDKPKLRSKLLVVGIFGTAIFYGDGVITPAISVLSAVEGLEVIDRQVFWAGYPGLVFCLGLAGHLSDHQLPRHLVGPEPALCPGLHVAQPGHHFCRAGRSGALRHRR
jgi:K+ transporter